MRCHSVGCGTPGQTQLATQSALPSIAADHIRGKPNCRRLGSGDSARKKDCFALSGGNRFVRHAFNGESGNSGDASVHADGAKSRFPKRVARALRQRNSLRVAMQVWGGACPCCRFHDCGPHFVQTERSGETASLISLIALSLRSQFHFVARPNVGRIYSRSYDAVISVCDDTGNVIDTHDHAIRLYDEVGNVIETHEHKGDFK
jgi:hypothetical protein